MLRLLNVATPATAARVSVPDRVAPALPVPAVIATVTLPVKVETRLPKASCPCTRTDGVIARPAVRLAGWTENPTRATAPAVMLNAALVAPVSAPEVAPRV